MDRPDAATLGQAYVVAPVDPRCRPVQLVPDEVGQVLNERATCADGHQLHAAADAEHRQIALQRRMQQTPQRAGST